jgi:exonuclease SbcC
MTEVIRRVAIENLRSHARTEFVFGPGTNVLVGPMGAGKSTVLEAISLALFGTCPAAKRQDVLIEDMIRQGEKEARVELEFVGKDGKVYTVVRKFGGKSEASLKSEGEGEEITKVRRVNEEVERRLGISYDVFERAVFAEQGRLDAPIAGAGRSRRERIDELLGLLVLEDARKNAMKIAKSLSDRAEELERTVSILERERVEEQLVEIASKISSLQRQISELQAEAERADKKYQETKAEVEKLREVRSQIEALRKQLVELEGKERQQNRWIGTMGDRLGEKARLPVEVLRAEAERLAGEVLAAEKELREIEQEEQRVQEEFLKASSQASNTAAKLESARKILEEKEEATKRLESLGDVDGRVGRLEEECRNLQAEISKLEANRERVEKAISSLRGAAGTCPTCQSPLSEERKEGLLREYESELGRCMENISRFRLDLEGKKAELGQWRSAQAEAQRLRAKAEGLEEAREQVRLLEGELGKIREEMEGLAARLGEVRDRKRAKEEEYRRLSGEHGRANEILIWREKLEEAKRELREIQAQKLQLNSQIASLAKVLDEERLSQLEQDLPGLAARAEGLRTKLEAARRELEEIQRRGEELEGKRRQLEEGRRRLSLLREYAAYLRKAKEALEGAQEEVRVTYVNTVNALMSSIWRQLYLPGRSTPIADVALRVVEGDYTLQALRNGIWVNVEGGVSGGERAVALFALRMAFALAIAPEFGLVVLDEPTYGLDQQAIETLAEVLREGLPQGIRQVILISHEPGLRDAATASVYELRNEGGVTVVG